MLNKETTAERLKQIMKEHSLKQVDILEKCKPYCNKYNVKMNKSDISQYVSGKVEPSQVKLKILSLALNVEEAWLMGYNVTTTNKKITSIYNLTDGLSDENIKELEKFAELLKLKQQHDQINDESCIALTHINE